MSEERKWKKKMMMKKKKILKMTVTRKTCQNVKASMLREKRGYELAPR